MNHGKNKAKSRGRKGCLKRLGYILFLLIFGLLALEVIYRLQPFDLYRAELKALNKKLPDTYEQTVLIFGDSFTANQESYVKHLRDALPHSRIINAAVPGTSTFEMAITSEQRLKKYEAEVVIIQLYIGNDLLDIDKPINWKKLSFIRNSYWWLAEHFRVLGYLNYKSGQLKGKTEADPKTDEVFSPDSYNAHTKLYLKSDPYYLEGIITHTDDYSKAYEKWMNYCKQIIANCPAGTEVYILPIPHCIQVEQSYWSNYKQLGAKWEYEANIQAAVYPLLLDIEHDLHESGLAQVLNPLPALQQAEAAGTSTYYANDPHLNSSGQLVIAEYLLQHIFE